MDNIIEEEKTVDEDLKEEYVEQLELIEKINELLKKMGDDNE